MEYTQDDYEVEAEKMFSHDYPNVYWALQKTPISGRRTASSQERADYIAKARIKLEAEDSKTNR